MLTPPGITPLTLRPSGTPPACSKTISSRRVPIGSSYRPGRITWPDTPKDRVARALLGAEAAEPVGAVLHDVRYVGEGLHVVDRGGHAEGAVLGGEGRLLARLSLLALQRLQQPGLFAADVGARRRGCMTTSWRSRCPSRSRPAAGGVGLVDGALQAGRRLGVLAAHVYEGLLEPVAQAAIRMPSSIWCGPRSSRMRSLNEPGSDSSALQTRYLGLSESLGMKGPLHAGREARAAATLEPRALHQLDHVVGRHLA